MHKEVGGVFWYVTYSSNSSKLHTNRNIQLTLIIFHHLRKTLQSYMEVRFIAYKNRHTFTEIIENISLSIICFEPNLFHPNCARVPRKMLVRVIFETLWYHIIFLFRLFMPFIAFL